MIFRHLLRLRQLERIFQDTWTEHLKTPSWRNRSPYPELQSWKGRVFALRARMYNFIQQMFDFAVSEVLEVRWNELRKKLERCETVDQLLKDHDNFLNTCTNECLLTNEKLLEVSRREKVAGAVITDAGGQNKLILPSSLAFSSSTRSCSTRATSLPTIRPRSRGSSCRVKRRQTATGLGSAASSRSTGISSAGALASSPRHTSCAFSDV
jgi:uncharacterized ubiquitin-like protein YukD